MTHGDSWGKRWRLVDRAYWAWQNLIPLLALVIAFYAVSKTIIVASDSNSALCALRGDLEKRVAGSREFLREHPEGIPGISAKVIRDGIENQSRTIRALSSLSCER